MGLDDYRTKRDFTKTSEPQGGEARGDTFVVQKHKARALHYDVRIEVEGVMPSWAVPKGPSYDPKVKRLAVHVEDHPLDYQDFEGAIPAGEYGGGSVIVWDRGTYRNIGDLPIRAAIEKGHVSVWFDGEKLHGGWSLTRTRRPGDRQDSWIMVKRNDEFANPDLDITSAAPASVLTAREVEAIRPDDPETWTRGRATWVPPMLATLAGAAPDGPEWVCERKFDGLRAIAVRNGDDVELWSRGHLAWASRFPTIAAAVADLAVDNVTLDGEIVAFDGDETSFTLLQHPGSAIEPVYVVFDVLHLMGQDTTSLPLADRRRLLEQIVEPGGPLRASQALTDVSLTDACRDGWEGLVYKRADSRYHSGRGTAWRKVKCDARQELVIGGWTTPRGTRTHFGALLVGVYDEAGGLRYAGKVGTGFDRPTLEDLGARLEALAVDASPFADAPRMRDAHWVAPELVAQVAFTEWTTDGKLRHPRFQGLRPDKAAAEVRRETPDG